MATTAEIEAAIAKAEAAGRKDLADKLRARISEASDYTPSQPDAARVEGAIAKAEAAGRKDLADKLRAKMPAFPAAPVAVSGFPTATPDGRAITMVDGKPMVKDGAGLRMLYAEDLQDGPSGPAVPPRADPVPGSPEARQQQIDEFVLFEMANPKLRGKFTPDTMPKAGESVMAGGGGGKSGAVRVTVQPYKNVRKPKAETFGGGAAIAMAPSVDAMKSFGAGILDSSVSPSYAALRADPILGQMGGNRLGNAVLASAGKFGDIGGAALSAVGAGASGVLGLGAELIPGVPDAGEAELAQGALVGAQFVVPELAGASSIVGKAAGTGKIKVPQIGTKPWRNAHGASEAKPSLESMRAAKNEAYKAVDEAGETFEAPEMGALRDKVKSDLDAGNYVSGVDKQTDAVVSLLDRKAGGKMTLGQLDKLRQEFYKRLAAAPNEVGIRDAIDAIDEMIAGKASSSELMDAARLSNSRYKKAELLDLAFQKAKDQTAATGSGGNILNKMRQAIVSIIDNPKNAKWFNKDEIATMRQFVEGSTGQNAMRLFGKLSPNGNGLMMALNLGAAGGTGGASLLVTGAAAGAKALADRAAIRGGDALIGKVAGTTKRAEAPQAGPQTVVPVPLAPAAGQAVQPDYEGLWKRYGG